MFLDSTFFFQERTILPPRKSSTKQPQMPSTAQQQAGLLANPQTTQSKVNPASVQDLMSPAVQNIMTQLLRVNATPGDSTLPTPPQQPKQQNNSPSQQQLMNNNSIVPPPSTQNKNNMGPAILSQPGELTLYCTPNVPDVKA